MEETIRLIVNKRIAANIRDGASPHGSNFVVYEDGMEVDPSTHIVITVKAEVWNRVDKGQQHQGDIEAIAGQCELQLGG